MCVCVAFLSIPATWGSALGGKGSFPKESPAKQTPRICFIRKKTNALWSNHPTKIAQLELPAAGQGILTFPELFRSCSVVWYVDNVAALMSLVRGRSDTAELDFMSQFVHLHCHSYWEWIQSKSNWADGISRGGFRDPWLLAHGFSIHRSSVPVYLWALPFRALSRVFAFL